MKIELRGIDSIRPYDNNPRQNDSAVDAVATSLREFGFRQPIVVDADGVIIAGHTRYKAALKLGLEKVPVHVATDLTPEQVRAYRIADNKSGELATWDLEILPIELAALQDAGYELDILAFDDDELAKLLGTEVKQGLTDPDQVPEPPEEAITRRGDIWILGDHRLICGDATSQKDLQRLVDGASINLFLSDPPYGVDYVGKTADALTIQGDAMPDAEYLAFLTEAFRGAESFMDAGAAFYIWHADTKGLLVREAVEAAGLGLRQCLVWVKDRFVLGRQDYHWQHEPCLYGWKPGAAHQWFSDKKQTTCLEFQRPARNSEHPTMKPVELCTYLIGNSSKSGNNVLDLFGGSGSTLIACEQMGRRCFTMELDESYCDVIVKRWEEFSGRKAERLEAKQAA